MKTAFKKTRWSGDQKKIFVIKFEASTLMLSTCTKLNLVVWDNSRAQVPDQILSIVTNTEVFYTWSLIRELGT